MPRQNSKHNISLYIHFPWCIKKCYYCDFNSHKANLTIPEDAYLTALLTDFMLSLQNIPTQKNLSLTSIFFGGGTPSLMSAKSIAKILNYINQHLHFTKDLEITLEANPGAIEQDNMQAYKDTGINRISLGAQSFNDQRLQQLGRIHTSKDITITLKNIIKADFNSFNIDIMYGLPNQNLAEAMFDLTTAINFNPLHISWYQLTIEPNTLFYSKSPQLPNEDLLWDMHDAGLALLQQNNFINYEVSAFAKDNYYCKHNLNYWQYGDYLGIGPGAHSKITIDNKINRWIKTKNPNKYLANCNFNIMDQQQVLNPKQIIFEFMLNSLRLHQGFSSMDFQQKTGVPLSTIQPILSKAVENNLLEIDKELIRTTNLGKRFLNNLQEMFL